MRIPIHPEGRPLILVLLGLSLAGYLAFGWPGWVIAGTACFVAYFFRDPERRIPTESGTVLSPADGRVIAVKAVRENKFLQSQSTMISIFLSVTDVHINRSPLEGRVAYQEYVPGKYLVAWAEKASEINERNYIGIESGDQRFLVCQIAGLVARRIVSWVAVGAQVPQGHRIGMIKFGSCTQIWLPPGYEAQVKPGDRVTGGLSVVGRKVGR